MCACKCVCMCLCTRVCRHVHGGQKTTLRSWFFPAIMYGIYRLNLSCVFMSAHMFFYLWSHLTSFSLSRESSGKIWRNFLCEFFPWLKIENVVPALIPYHISLKAKNCGSVCYLALSIVWEFFTDSDFLSSSLAVKSSYPLYQKVDILRLTEKETCLNTFCVFACLRTDFYQW